MTVFPCRAQPKASTALGKTAGAQAPSIRTPRSANDVSAGAEHLRVGATTGNVRHLHAGQRFSEDHPDGNDPDYTGDLGGYAYTAFGKRLAASDVGGLPPPAGFPQPFTWQGKRGLGGNLYYSRARIWSADLGAFLQPDQYVFLTPGGTLWSWPGQNPFRWADPSGRLAGSYELLRAAQLARALGPAGAAAAAAAFSLALFSDQVNGLGAEIFAQQDANLNAIARAAAKDAENQGRPNPGTSCADASGGGAKGPPAAKGDVGADSPDPSIPRKVLDALRHIQGTKTAPPGMRGGGDFANDGRGNGELLPQAGPDGNPIRYREWDVNRWQPGVNRGLERLVTGSDGSAYYTSNHYRTFIRIP